MKEYKRLIKTSTYEQNYLTQEMELIKKKWILVFKKNDNEQIQEKNLSEDPYYIYQSLSYQRGSTAISSGMQDGFLNYRNKKDNYENIGHYLCYAFHDEEIRDAISEDFYTLEELLSDAEKGIKSQDILPIKRLIAGWGDIIDATWTLESMDNHIDLVDPRICELLQKVLKMEESPLFRASVIGVITNVCLGLECYKYFESQIKDIIHTERNEQAREQIKDYVETVDNSIRELLEEFEEQNRLSDLEDHIYGQNDYDYDIDFFKEAFEEEGVTIKSQKDGYFSLYIDENIQDIFFYVNTDIFHLYIEVFRNISIEESQKPDILFLIQYLEKENPDIIILMYDNAISFKTGLYYYQVEMDSKLIGQMIKHPCQEYIKLMPYFEKLIIEKKSIESIIELYNQNNRL
ncbi:MAG: hypothetical protein MUC49_22750 [Raineya sp.]|jgi:hypothetical protein|nr:hypothetical protein [Raineya sp.]